MASGKHGKLGQTKKEWRTKANETFSGHKTQFMFRLMNAPNLPAHPGSKEWIPARTRRCHAPIVLAANSSPYKTDALLLRSKSRSVPGHTVEFYVIPRRLNRLGAPSIRSRSQALLLGLVLYANFGIE
jgi:hypothetical protein